MLLCPHFCDLAAHGLLAVNVLDAGSLLTAFGALGVAVVLFAETGLLVGFFLPGDSLLFTAGLLCVPGGQGCTCLFRRFSLPRSAGRSPELRWGTGSAAGAAGRSSPAAGPGTCTREPNAPRSCWSATGTPKPSSSHASSPSSAPSSIPWPALDVPARVFILWQVIGGLVWTVGLVLAGYALGSSIPNVDRYLLPLVALIVLLSLLPLAREVLRSRRARRDRGAAGGEV